MLKNTKDFKVSQFQCNHCHSNGIQQELIDKMQEIKDITGSTIFIVGAYRCKIHNKNLGKDGNLLFVKGLAVNIRMADTEGLLLNGKEMIDIIDQNNLLTEAKVSVHNTFITIELGGDYVRDFQKDS